MKIFYDYQVFTNKVSGASRAFCEIATLASLENSVYFGTKKSTNIYLKVLKPDLKEFLPGINFKGKSHLNNAIELNYSLSIIKENNFDLMHVTGENCYFLNFIKKPFIITIHDLIPENYLNNEKRIHNRAILIERASRIITVSENTKKELINIYGNEIEYKVDIVYHGFTKSKLKYAHNRWGRYILFVGQRASYKNFYSFIKALIPILKEDKTLTVFCAGAPLNNEEVSYLSNLNIANRVMAEYVSDSDLYSLYKHAQAFVFPSLYEGFGIPILESFGNSCPAVISNTSCFPEIAGDAACYFDPKDEKSISDAVKKVIYDKEYSDYLRKKGHERVALYTWEKSTSKMMDCYRNSIKASQS
ncbi:glycosyltransferase family 4 protein [Spirosoma flavum]|uniref:Glycosyltransferase family 4 protein n=1 Tax=Spirosoma flavum TaxID=2048557 RepID=A0ABW6AFF3_9BACT